MAFGPGKYDDLCTYVREQSEGESVIVLVVGGRLGSGISRQVTAGAHTYHVMMAEVATLRAMADDIEAYAQQRGN